MLLHLSFFQPLAQAVDDLASMLVLTYDVIKNFAYLGEICVVLREHPLVESYGDAPESHLGATVARLKAS